MLRLETRSVDEPDAAALLDAYFIEREAGRPADAGPYTRPVPDPLRFLAPQGGFLLARADGEALGCGGVRQVPAQGGHPLGGSHWFEVKHLFVVPSARGQGLSRFLMAGLEAAARELGADRLVLDTHTSQRAAAELYFALGYEPIPPYNRNANANLWFGRSLAASSASQQDRGTTDRD